VLAAIVALSTSVVASFAAGACLPDLAPIAEETSTVTPFRGCGDGIIATLADGTDSGESCDPGDDTRVSGCANCQITCPSPFIDPKSGHCYFVAGADSSYGAAVTRCKLERAHVVTLASVEEIAFVRNLAADEAGYWVGLSRSSPLLEAYASDRPEEPGFQSPPDNAGASVGPCLGCFGLGADAGVFPSAEPDASAPARCVASRGGTWLQVPCDGTSRPTVCEREPVGVRTVEDCIIGGFCFTVPVTAGEKSYLVVVSASDPDQAALTCAGLDGGSLAVMETREEREQVAHEILARYPEEVEQQLWIGLVADGGAWSWEDGVPAGSSASRPLPWGNAQPPAGPPTTGARAYMRLAATAYDTQLAYVDNTSAPAPRLYICQRPAR
jgi:hypothetical protein